MLLCIVTLTSSYKVLPTQQKDDTLFAGINTCPHKLCETALCVSHSSGTLHPPPYKTQTWNPIPTIVWVCALYIRTSLRLLWMQLSIQIMFAMFVSQTKMNAKSIKAHKSLSLFWSGVLGQLWLATSCHSQVSLAQCWFILASPQLSLWPSQEYPRACIDSAQGASRLTRRILDLMSLIYDQHIPGPERTNL